MSFGELIPQVFYDGIARFVAGLTIIGTCALVWWPDLMVLRDIVGKSLCGAPVITAFIFLTAAYVIALLLEGLWSLTTALLKILPKPSGAGGERSGQSEKSLPQDKVWERSIGQFDRIFYKIKRPVVRPSGAFAIDAVRLVDSDVGARIVKLRAEESLCRTLCVGWIAIAVAYVIWFCFAVSGSGSIPPGVAKLIVTVLGLGVVCLTIHFRQRSLGERHLTALFNHWLLLIDPGVKVVQGRRDGKD